MAGYKIDTTGGGTGVFTIATPNSNTDRTLTLPDEAGTVLTSASSIPVANLDSAVGVTEVDIWRLTTDLGKVEADGQYVITNNLERNDTATFSKLGTGMSQSSGVFTFPSTGLWSIKFYGNVYVTSSGANTRYLQQSIEVSTDSGSNWSEIAQGFGQVEYTLSSTSIGGITVSGIVNVTDASTYRVRFTVFAAGNSAANAYWNSSSSMDITKFEFVRLGDAQ